MDLQPELTTNVARLVDASALAGVAPMADAAALASGEVAIIGLDAIARKLGPRWASRRELVYEHTERTLQRRVDGGGFFQRISDTAFVVVLPGLGRSRAQSLCLSALREVLQHFLGEAVAADAIIHEISRIEGNEIYAEPLDVARIEAAAADVAPAPGPKPPPPDTAWSPFIAGDGRKVRVSCTLEPLYHLRNSQRIGYRIARRVVEVGKEKALSLAEQRDLVTSDVERMDFATMARGLDRLRSARSEERLPTLVLPVSYTTLASRRSRGTLLEFLSQAQAAVRHGVICEVRDIEGVPPSGLAAACGILRPFCLFVVGHLEGAPTAAIRGLRDCGLQGLSIDCPVIAEDAAFIQWARTVAAHAKPVAKSLIAYRLGSIRHAAIAGLTGITHGTLRPAEV